MGTAIARTPTTMPTPMTIRLYKSSPSQIPFLDVFITPNQAIRLQSNPGKTDQIDRDNNVLTTEV